MDIFTWSLPFLAEKVMNMMFHIIAKVGSVDDDEDFQENNEDNKEVSEKAVGARNKKKKKNVFKAKLNGITKM